MDGAQAERVVSAAQSVTDAGNSSTQIFLDYFVDCLIAAQTFWTESDFQTKLLIILISCLTLNLILIRSAWKVYGASLTEMLTRDVTGKDCYEDLTRIQTEDLLYNKFPQSQKIHRD